MPATGAVQSVKSQIVLRIWRFSPVESNSQEKIYPSSLSFASTRTKTPSSLTFVFQLKANALNRNSSTINFSFPTRMWWIDFESVSMSKSPDFVSSLLNSVWFTINLLLFFVKKFFVALKWSKIEKQRIKYNHFKTTKNLGRIAMRPYKESTTKRSFATFLKIFPTQVDLFIYLPKLLM